MNELLIVFACLQIKHVIIDWILQPKWMWSVKHIYGHIGGVSHACFNGFGTALVISNFYEHFWLIFMLDSIIHYHIDWFKMNLNINLNISPENKYFWYFLGLDQYCHQMTYILILFLILNGLV